MKKLFSLVALAGMFMLMSFSFNEGATNLVAADGGWDYCNEYATEYAQQYDWDSSYQRSWYNACIALQE